MNMTWKELAEQISAMTPEQQGTDVTVFVRGVDEFYPLSEEYPLVIVDSKDQSEHVPGLQDSSSVLDEGHPYLVI